MACRSLANCRFAGVRLGKIKKARATIEARAKERHAREMAEHEAKMAAREAKIAATGKKPGGKPPARPVEGPDSTRPAVTEQGKKILFGQRAASETVR